MSEFVRRYGAIYEHSPWVAEAARKLVSDGAGIEEIGAAMARCVDEASIDRQLELIRAHPDLAGRAQVAGELTEDSASEQASAGLDRCTPAQFESLQSFNAQYRDKFGFPFIKAVRGSSVSQILGAFERRLGNDYEAEFQAALAEIHKIARLRLEAMEGAGRD